MFKPSKAHVSGLQWDGCIDYQHCKKSYNKVDQWGTYLFNINYEKLHKLLKNAVQNPNKIDWKESFVLCMMIDRLIN